MGDAGALGNEIVWSSSLWLYDLSFDLLTVCEFMSWCVCVVSVSVFVWWQLTRMFHSSNNWRRLLNLNPTLTPDPQALMDDGQVVQIGSVYSILPGDSLAAISGLYLFISRSHSCTLAHSFFLARTCAQWSAFPVFFVIFSPSPAFAFAPSASASPSPSLAPSLVIALSLPFLLPCSCSRSRARCLTLARSRSRSRSRTLSGSSCPSVSFSDWDWVALGISATQSARIRRLSA